ncbi:MAG: LegC family aminotransferase [Arenicella sp.]
MINSFTELVRSIYQTKDFIPLHAPVFSSIDKSMVADAIDSTFVSSVSDYVGKFEYALSEFTGAKHVIPVVNGTSGIHLALHAIGVDSDCEVLTQSLTFAATCNAIAYTGAKPVLVDVDSENMGLCPNAITSFLEEYAEMRSDDGVQAKAVNKLTGKHIAACIPMHTFGHPVKFAELKCVCDKWNIVIIEDSAEALGSFVHVNGLKRHCGTLGLMGVLSFNGNKPITTGGGGAILTDNDAYAERLRHLSTTAKLPHAWEYVHDEMGFNYRMPGLNAALGCGQMAQLGGFLADKRQITDAYRCWASNEGVSFVDAKEGAQPNFWLNALILEDKQQRDEFLTETNQQGVMTRPIWQPMHLLKHFQDVQRTDLSNTLNIMDRLVNVPSSSRSAT